MNKKTDISVIIPAAGRGKRMGTSPASKPFIKLKGMPILFHTINKFKNISGIKEIIIAINRRDQKRVERLLRGSRRLQPANNKRTLPPKASLPPIRRPSGRASPKAGARLATGGAKGGKGAATNNKSSTLKLVRGGLRRQDSVYNALKVVAPTSRYVLIHDAARPLVKKTDIIKLISETKKYGACLLAIPTTDTIKRINPITKQVKYTLTPREEFWSVQTPQGFKKDILMAAYKKAQKQRLITTDDASLVEALGYPVKIIPGRYENIKMTTATDKIFCEALIKIYHSRMELSR